MEFENDVTKTNSNEGRSVCRLSLVSLYQTSMAKTTILSRTMINMILLAVSITILQGGLTNTPCIHHHQNFVRKTLASENLIVNPVITNEAHEADFLILFSS